MKALTFIANFMLLVASTAVCFVIAASIFNLGRISGVVDTLVAGQYNPPTDSIRLDDEPEELQVVDFTPSWSGAIQPAARAYFSQPTVSDAYVQWGQM